MNINVLEFYCISVCVLSVLCLCVCVCVCVRDCGGGWVAVVNGGGVIYMYYHSCCVKWQEGQGEEVPLETRTVQCSAPRHTYSVVPLDTHTV